MSTSPEQLAISYSAPDATNTDLSLVPAATNPRIRVRSLSSNSADSSGSDSGLSPHTKKAIKSLSDLQSVVVTEPDDFTTALVHHRNSTTDITERFELDSLLAKYELQRQSDSATIDYERATVKFISDLSAFALQQQSLETEYLRSQLNAFTTLSELEKSQFANTLDAFYSAQLQLQLTDYDNKASAFLLHVKSEFDQLTLQLVQAKEALRLLHADFASLQS